MAITYLAYDKSKRRPMPKPPAAARGSYYPVSVLERHDEASRMRDGDACPRCGWTRQARFGLVWHWVCCGETVPA